MEFAVNFEKRKACLVKDPDHAMVSNTLVST